MPAVVHYEIKKGGVELRDVPIPTAGDNECTRFRSGDPAFEGWSSRL